MRLKPVALLTVFAALLFAAGGCGKKPPKVNYSKASTVTATLGQKNIESGLYQVNKMGDGATTPTKVVGQECQQLQPMGDDAYMYFKIDRTFKTNTSLNLKVTVEYYDVSPSILWIEYDGWKENGGQGGIYDSSVERIRIGNPMNWRTAVFTLEKGRLENRQEDGADFRIRVSRAPLYVHAVTVERFSPAKDY